MATFTLLITVSGYDSRPMKDVTVFASALTTPYPDPDGDTIHADVVKGVTDATGIVEMALVSLPGLQYKIESWTLGEPRIIAGDWPDGSVKRLEHLIDVVPSPIRPVEAASLRAEIAELRTMVLALTAQAG